MLMCLDCKYYSALGGGDHGLLSSCNVNSQPYNPYCFDSYVETRLWQDNCPGFSERIEIWLSEIMPHYQKALNNFGIGE